MLFVTFCYRFSFFIQTKHIFQVFELALDGHNFLHCPFSIASLHQQSHRRFRYCKKNYMAWLSHAVLVERIWKIRPFLQTIYSNEGKYKFFFNIWKKKKNCEHIKIENARLYTDRSAYIFIFQINFINIHHFHRNLYS